MRRTSFPIPVIIAIAIAAVLLAAFLFVDFGFETEPDGATGRTSQTAAPREAVGQEPAPPPGG